MLAITIGGEKKTNTRKEIEDGSVTRGESRKKKNQTLKT